MPELPEVETTVNIIKKKVLNRTFLGVWTDHLRAIKKPSGLAGFQKEIKNKKIKEVRRVGKNIIFDLSKGYSLLIHQKMTGHLLYGLWQKNGGQWQAKGKGPIKKGPMNKFIHFIFFLDNGKQIALSDLRKFAKIELGATKEINKEVALLGPDPLKISFSQFKEILSRAKGKIKTVLMNQKIISGVGNIYSDEALFMAKIHPLRPVSEIKQAETKALYASLRKVLRKAIDVQGASISDYRTPSGEKGGFDKIIKVYRRQGKKCPRCGSIIKRIKINGRSAHFCPVCQKL